MEKRHAQNNCKSQVNIEIQSKKVQWMCGIRSTTARFSNRERSQDDNMDVLFSEPLDSRPVFDPRSVCTENPLSTAQLHLCLTVNVRT